MKRRPTSTAFSPPPSFGVRGVLVAADYPGLGPNGQRHSYLSGTEPARSVLLENVPARRTTSAPLLLVQGDADPVVVPARTDALISSLCALAAEVELVTIPGAAHDVARHVATSVIGPWIEARFAGEPTGSSCP